MGPRSWRWLSRRPASRERWNSATMPSSVSHGLAATLVAIAAAPAAPRRALITSAVLGAVAMDLDAVGRPFGLGDLMWLGGHRGFTHSVPFALGLATVVAAFRFRGDPARSRIAAALAIAYLTHGLLDALTSYGSGIMYWAPLSAERYRAPRRPLRGRNEVYMIWAPAVTALLWMRARTRRSDAP